MRGYAKQRAEKAAAAAQAARLQREPSRNAISNEIDAPKPPVWLIPLVALTRAIASVGGKIRKCMNPHAADQSAPFQLEDHILVAPTAKPNIQLGANAAVAEHYRREESSGAGGVSARPSVAEKVRAYQTQGSDRSVARKPSPQVSTPRRSPPVEAARRPSRRNSGASIPTEGSVGSIASVSSVKQSGKSSGKRGTARVAPLPPAEIGDRPAAEGMYATPKALTPVNSARGGDMSSPRPPLPAVRTPARADAGGFRANRRMSGQRGKTSSVSPDVSTSTASNASSCSLPDKDTCAQGGDHSPSVSSHLVHVASRRPSLPGVAGDTTEADLPGKLKKTRFL